MIVRIDNPSLISRAESNQDRSVVVRENEVFVVSNQQESFAIRSNHVEVYPVEKFVYGETPTPPTNATQLVFTVANAYISGTLCVTRGSLRMHPTADFSETSSTTFTMVVAPDSSEPLIVDYIKA